MKITGLGLENWLCHRHLSLDFFSPLTLISGDNEAGKTACRDAIAFAMMGALSRIEAAKDRAALITEGQTSGTVTLRCSGGGVAMACVRDIATGKLKGRPTEKMPIGSAATGAVPYVLDTTRFAGGEPDARRSLLLEVMRVSVDAATIRATLIERGHALAAELPADEDGYETWQEVAKERASQERGIWKSATGETYGERKAETWALPIDEATDPDAKAELERDVDGLRAQLAQLRTARGAAEEKLRAWEESQTKIAGLKERIARKPAAQAALETAAEAVLACQIAEQEAANCMEQTRAMMRTSPVYYCTRCRTPHVFSDNTLVEVTGDIDAPTATQSDYLNAQAAHAKMKVATDLAHTIHLSKKQILRTIEDAEAAIALGLSGGERPPDTKEIDEQITRIETLALPAVLDRLAASMASEINVKRAIEINAKAKAAHEGVQAWMAIARLVEPSGIPAEQLTKALAPFNARLAVLAGLFGYEPVRIGDDMAITRGSRAYRMLSKSGKWGCDLMIAIALAEASDVRFVVVDEFDVLAPGRRKSALVALYNRTKQGAMDSVILLGTLRELPGVPADVNAYWLGDK